MKVLVTGGSGQLGHDVVRRLRDSGFGVEAPGVETLDLRKPDTIRQTVTSCRPDAVINCAAYTQVDQAESEPEQAFSVNRDAAACLAATAAETDAKLLHVSTDFVFDGRGTRPYHESDATGPLGVYGHSKRAGEIAVLEAMPAAIVLRTAWLYGVHGHNFVKTILRAAREGRPLRVVDDQVGAPTWSANVAEVLARLLETDAGGVFHYTDAGSTSWCGFAQAILDEAAATGFTLQTCEVQPVTTAEYPTAAQRPAYSVLDTDRIRTLLDIDIPPWRDSLRNMLEELHTCADC